tara:strand:+ start:443 stop:1372 length:930 start_codon:yes stop_codon:yes gene_type:complete
MARRSTKLLRFENNLYSYDKENQIWKTNPISFSKAEDSVDLFEKGSLSTCKHMSQKINPNLLRTGFLHSWDFSSFLEFKVSSYLNNNFFFKYFLESYISSSLKVLQGVFDKLEIKQVNNIFYIKIFCYFPKNIDRNMVKIPGKKVKAFQKAFPEEKDSLSIFPFFSENLSDTKERKFLLEKQKLINHFEKYISRFYKKEVRISLFKRNNIGDSPSLLANFLARDLEKSNANFKRALRETFKEIKNNSNIRGIRINCSGRLGKNPMAKTEWFKYGQVPLNQINANLGYSSSLASTKYGSIGVKVWVYYHK